MSEFGSRLGRAYSSGLGPVRDDARKVAEALAAAAEQDPGLFVTDGRVSVNFSNLVGIDTRPSRRRPIAAAATELIGHGMVRYENDYTPRYTFYPNP